MEWKKIAKFVAMALTFVGSIAWGVIGVGGPNIVTSILGGGYFTNIMYILVGVSAIYLLVEGKK